MAHPELRLQELFVAKLKSNDIIVYKFESPGNAGVPDLLCVAPGGDVFFIELKRPDGRGKLSPLQEYTINKLTQQGAQVYVTSDICDAERIGLKHGAKRRD